MKYMIKQSRLGKQSFKSEIGLIIQLFIYTSMLLKGHQFVIKMRNTKSVNRIHKFIGVNLGPNI